MISKARRARKFKKREKVDDASGREEEGKRINRRTVELVFELNESDGLSSYDADSSADEMREERGIVRSKVAEEESKKRLT